MKSPSQATVAPGVDTSARKRPPSRGLRSVGAAWFAIAAAVVACSAPACVAGDSFGVAPALTDYPTGGAFGRASASQEPCDDGVTEVCHETIGENADLITCMEGVRTCVDGAWGPCVGTFSSRPMLPEADTGEPDHRGDRQDSLGVAATCANNPCDPSCKVYDEVPVGGVSVTPTATGSYLQGTLADAKKLNPAGFVDKGIKTPCASVSDCEFDEHCVATGTYGATCGTGVAKCCTPWKPGETDTTCAKPDFTAGFACTNNGVPTVEVCNRGTVTAPAGVAIYIFPGNSAQFPTCSVDKSSNVCATPTALAPGKCVNVTGCPGLNGNGTKTLMVNPPKTGTAANAAWQDECTCGNNWSVWSGNAGACTTTTVYQAAPLTYRQTYSGVCPAGTHVQWSYFAYQTTTPTDSNVVFAAHAGATTADVAAAQLTTIATAQLSPNTQSCAMAGPTPCPKNLYTALGAASATQQLLEIVMTLNPSSDKSVSPTVSSWDVTYSCPPSE